MSSKIRCWRPKDRKDNFSGMPLNANLSFIALGKLFWKAPMSSLLKLLLSFPDKIFRKQLFCPWWNCAEMNRSFESLLFRYDKLLNFQFDYTWIFNWFFSDTTSSLSTTNFMFGVRFRDEWWSRYISSFEEFKWQKYQPFLVKVMIIICIGGNFLQIVVGESDIKFLFYSCRIEHRTIGLLVKVQKKNNLHQGKTCCNKKICIREQTCCSCLSANPM